VRDDGRGDPPGSAELSYDVVDVFTDRPYAGNPLAVVHGAGHLATADLQAMAREFNLSETSFPVPVDSSTYAVRIFTPETEVPFAGHPTVGTAWVLRQRGELTGERVVQRCGAGDVAVEVSAEGARLSAAVLELGEPLHLPEFMESFGLSRADLHSPLRAASCGLGFLYARVDAEAVRRSHPAAGTWRPPDAGLQDPMGGLCVYAVEPDADDADGAEGIQVLARVFCPEAGVPEDPATGSAAAGLGVILVASGLAPGDGYARYTVSQGAQLGRPSRLDCAVEAAGGLARVVHVGGGVRPVARGTVRRPPTTS